MKRLILVFSALVLFAGCAHQRAVVNESFPVQRPHVKCIWKASTLRSVPFTVIVYKSEDYRHILNPGMADTIQGVFWVDERGGDYEISGDTFVTRVPVVGHSIRIEDPAQGASQFITRGTP